MKKALRKRSVRNTIMIAMIVALSACSCFTYGYAKEQAQSKAIDSIQEQFGEMPSGNMPDLGSNSQAADNQTDGNEQTTDNQAPPDMNNGAQGEFDGSTPPDMQNGNDASATPEMNDAPDESAADGTESANGPSRSENGPSRDSNQQMPSGDAAGRPQRPDQNGGEVTEGTSDSQMPELPNSGNTGDAQSADGESTTESANGPSRRNNQQMPGGGNDQQMTPPDFNKQAQELSGSASAQIEAQYIALLAAENLIIAASLIYLILSGFNKRGFRKTLKNTKNAIIFSLAVLLLTAGITTAQIAASGQAEIPFNAPQASGGQMLEPPGDNGQASDENTTEEESTERIGNQADIEFSI